MEQTQEHLVSTEAQRYLLIYMVVVLVIVTALVILFFIVFQKRKNRLLLDKIEQQQAFDEEIRKTQSEIQEQTLKYIASELHDNLGQLLVYANMQLKSLSNLPETIKGKINETAEVISESLSEVRLLSKSLNNDVILNMGLEQSVTNELNRLKKLKFEKAELNIKGKKVDIANKKHEIVIFRILQEFLSNAVKYSEADAINIELNYLPDKLIIAASDNGKGFDIETVEKGSGLINMKSRAELISATFNLSSKSDEGVALVLEYPLVS